MGEGPGFSPQVCLSCKAKKKKCSKHLPACELCVKLLLQCQYNYGQFSPKYEVYTRDASAPDLEASATLLSALPECPVPSAATGEVDVGQEITSQVLSLLNDHGLSVSAINLAYFRTIHIWFPILSKEKWQSRTDDITAHPSAELAGLLISMALITQSPVQKTPDNPMNNTVYYKAKALFMALVSSGNPSLDIVQAGILVSLYEQGHGMRESARITIASCSRLAIKLNVLERRQQTPDVQDTEFGRSWWGLVILDRFMNLGLPSDEIHLVADSQVLRSVRLELPNDNEECKDLTSVFQRTPSGVIVRQPTTRLGPFCRTAQASHLLGQTLELAVSSAIDGLFDNRTWMSIDQSLRELAMSLLQQAINGWEECCASIGVCVSALLTLHQARRECRSTTMLYDNMDDGQTRKREYETAIMAIRSAVRIVIDIARRFLTDLAYIDLPSLPLPATFTVYQAALLHIDLSGPDMHSSEWIQDFQSLKGALAHFAKRWDVGQRYLSHLNVVYSNAIQDSSRHARSQF
ncbi:fungal specific transcription factor [Phlyctema vagabunda]|uniref:Fungal specific transcription factor n=1 Tax=Phlyctema vagabunda TaxID=108571 RepID=A0ABR4P975_9HELO